MQHLPKMAYADWLSYNSILSLLRAVPSVCRGIRRFCVHHFCSDIVSWQILSNGLSRLLRNKGVVTAGYHSHDLDLYMSAVLEDIGGSYYCTVIVGIHAEAGGMPVVA
jgi:hypothetical protein